MSTGLQLLKLSGTFTTAHGGQQAVHGIATVMKVGLTLGVMFDSAGNASTFEAVPAPMDEMTGVAMVCATLRSDLKSIYALRASEVAPVIGAGSYRATHLVDNPPLPELNDGARHVTVLLKHVAQARRADFVTPNAELQLAEVPWHEAYGALAEAERCVADVVVWFAMFDEILGPDKPRDPLNFYSAATCRAALARRGARELTPWSITAPMIVP